MRRILLGFVFGTVFSVFAFFVFIYFGGGKYIKELGSETEKAGTVLEGYGKDMRGAADKAKEGFKEYMP